MSLIDSVFHNFANHVHSGLSGFIVNAYDACQRLEKDRLRVQVLGPPSVLDDAAVDAELAEAVLGLRSKFLHILACESQMPPDDVAELVIDIDFAPDIARVEERRRQMADIPVYYGYDPVYRCTVQLQLRAGARRSVTVEDRSS